MAGGGAGGCRGLGAGAGAGCVSGRSRRLYSVTTSGQWPCQAAVPAPATSHQHPHTPAQETPAQLSGIQTGAFTHFQLKLDPEIGILVISQSRSDVDIQIHSGWLLHSQSIVFVCCLVVVWRLLLELKKNNIFAS